MALKGPNITVLMSVYNGSRWLEEAISSVLKQTLSNFEFIIVNDGSTDESLQIINGFECQDSRIKVINKKNTGLADSLNIGIKQARGEWIARIDADDVCEPERLQKQYELSQSNPDLVLIGTGLREIDEVGRQGKVYRYPAAHEALLHNLTTDRRFFAHSSAFYRGEIVRRLGGYRTRFKRAQDWDLWLRLSEVGSISCLIDPLVRIRNHTDQISHEESGQRQQIDSYVAMISYWLRRRDVIDPVSTDVSEDYFNIFRDWVVQRLNQKQVFEFNIHVQRVKRQLATKLSIKNLLNTLIAILKNPKFTLKYFYRVAFGNPIAKKLAGEWEIKEKPSMA